MSDFPELEDFSNVPASNDPQADFLARERALLGDEFGPTPDNYQETRQEQNGFDAPAPSLYANQPSAYATQRYMPKHSQKKNRHLSREWLYCPILHSSSVGYNNTKRETPPKLDCFIGWLAFREWRTKQAEEIRLRDQRSIAKREETITAAERLLMIFTMVITLKNKKISLRISKEEEAEFLQTRNDKLGQGTTWERISEVIELQDSRSKTCGKSNKDLARFKEILLSLKREGESAPGAAVLEKKYM
ncbi:hypothetical protein KEM48_008183 [Puccinia striiformis f. sp. tritici PST-130]|nr:hypothetical protein KEM48_008183 [Puccinia striiformis f. sp. tritici PST-130]